MRSARLAPAAGAANRAFGLDRGMPFPLSDIAAADVVVLVGSNPADTMPPAMQYFDEGRARGAQHVVVDPRRTATARHAALHLQPLPGTDLALLENRFEFQRWLRKAAAPRSSHPAS